MTGRSTGPSCCPAPTPSASAASPGSWPPRRGSSASGDPPPPPPRPAPSEDTGQCVVQVPDMPGPGADPPRRPPRPPPLLHGQPADGPDGAAEEGDHPHLQPPPRPGAGYQVSPLLPHLHLARSCSAARPATWCSAPRVWGAATPATPATAVTTPTPRTRTTAAPPPATAATATVLSGQCRDP